MATFGRPPHTRLLRPWDALAPRTSRGSSGLWRRHLNGCGIAYAGFRPATGRHHELYLEDPRRSAPRKTPHDPPAADTTRAGSPRRDPPRGLGRGPRAGQTALASDLKGRFALWKNPANLTPRQQLKLAHHGTDAARAGRRVMAGGMVEHQPRDRLASLPRLDRGQDRTAASVVAMTTDPDEERLFTSAEKRDYNPLRCPDCGGRSLYYDFAPAGGVFEDPAPRFRRALCAATRAVRPTRMPDWPQARRMARPRWWGAGRRLMRSSARNRARRSAGAG
jgi:hypothetical protein